MRQVLSVISILAATGVTLAALQAGSGTIQGRVTDVDGVPLPGVTVTVVAPGFERSVVSSPSGEYEFINLPPGRYSLGANIGSHGMGAGRMIGIIADGTVTYDFRFPRGCLGEPAPSPSLDLSLEEMLKNIDVVAHVRVTGVSQRESMIVNETCLWVHHHLGEVLETIDARVRQGAPPVVDRVLWRGRSWDPPANEGDELIVFLAWEEVRGNRGWSASAHLLFRNGRLDSRGKVTEITNGDSPGDVLRAISTMLKSTAPRR